MRTDSEAQRSTGGLVTDSGAVRRWRWNGRADAASAPVVCRRDQWYLVRAQSNGHDPASESVLVEFFSRDGHSSRRCIELVGIDGPSAAHDPESKSNSERLGWVQSPPDATHVRLLARGGRVTLHSVSERDPKSHPLASVPRWSTCRRPFPIDHVVLPESLRSLGGVLDGFRIETIRTPGSLRELAAKVIGKAWVLDPAWAVALKLTWADVEKVAGGSWAVVDLETTARLHTAGGLADARIATRRDDDGIMSARVEYYDVATCGFALMDVVPYGTATLRQELSPGDQESRTSGFAVRVLRANRSWKRYAEECGFAMLLSSQTPLESQCNDVVSATKAVHQGEVVATDLPWLVAGVMGDLLAPRIARQLLRTHLGATIDDRVQFWNRWDDARIVVRDIADLTRRHSSLRPVRFSRDEDGGVRLGVTFDGREGRAEGGAKTPRGASGARRLLIQTGRIDLRDAHDGLPPEPMMIFMKWLAREWSEATPWAREHLRDTTITWQFDSAEGLKYATLYEAADVAEAERALRLRAGSIPVRLGVLGDGSLEYQAALTERIVGWIVLK